MYRRSRVGCSGRGVSLSGARFITALDRGVVLSHLQFTPPWRATSPGGRGDRPRHGCLSGGSGGVIRQAGVRQEGFGKAPSWPWGDSRSLRLGALGCRRLLALVRYRCVRARGRGSWGLTSAAACIQLFLHPALIPSYVHYEYFSTSL